MWLIEYYNEYNGLHKIAQALKEQGIPHKLINVLEGDEYNGVRAQNLTFFGSLELADTLFKEGKTGLWLGSPSFFMSSIKDCPYLLNKGELTTLKEVLENKDDLFSRNSAGFFIRPDSYEKFFSGQVLNEENFDRNLRNITLYNSDLTIRVIISPLKEIKKEVRLLFINNSLVTGSSYEVEQMNQEEANITEYQDFVEKIKNFIPSSHCTIDVAHTSEGLNLVEFNPLSTSAIYQSNPYKIIKALI